MPPDAAVVHQSVTLVNVLALHDGRMISQQGFAGDDFFRYGGHFSMAKYPPKSKAAILKMKTTMAALRNPLTPMTVLLVDDNQKKRDCRVASTEL